MLQGQVHGKGYTQLQMQVVRDAIGYVYYYTAQQYYRIWLTGKLNNS